MNDPITNSPAPEGCPAPLCSVRFGDIALGGYFVYRDHLWEKVGESAGLADGYEASNHFGEDFEVFYPQNDKNQAP